MRATLIKDKDGYSLFLNKEGSTDREFIATTDGMYVKYKLSKQNCDYIFGIIDVEKLADEYIEDDVISSDEKSTFVFAFLNGMELNKDKVFTLKDVETAMRIVFDWSEGDNHSECTSLNELLNKFQFLQQPKEIAVEIEVEKISRHKGRKSVFECKQLKLDSDGCLILKKIK